jgi:hypothetical protein
MAIGDDATAAGYPLVPVSGSTGSPGKVKQGWQEINRTRDFVAQVKALIPGSKALFRAASGVFSGTADPTVTPPAGATDGDIYFKIIP